MRFLKVLALSLALSSRAIEIQHLGASADAKIQETVQAAVEQIREFARKNKLAAIKPEDFAAKVVVYASKADFDSMIQGSPDWPKNQKVPKNFVGVGEKKVFHVVSWEAYKQVHPDESYSDYQKLMTHELAHLFHIAYPHGDENKMGPIWFYEGFACLVAGQYPQSRLPPNAEISLILQDPRRGNYPSYAAILRMLAGATGIKELLDNASDPKFSEQMGTLMTNMRKTNSV